MPYLAMAAYKCDVAGEATDSLDIQVRYFERGTMREVEEALRSEQPHSYENEGGQIVSWSLANIFAIEHFDKPKSGAEVIGFITGADEFANWAAGEGQGQGPYMATRELTAVRAPRGEFRVTVALGRPYRIDQDEWACAVQLNGLHDNVRDQHAADSFQALMLAQNLAKSLLSAFIEEGGLLLDSPGGNVVNVEHLFRTGVN
jgi:Domain of unknown function (DUF6968)